MTLVKKSQRRTAPRKIETKLNPDAVKLFRYLVIKPHRTMSTPTHAKSGTMRDRLPLIR
jgi:hypothetical protein